MSPVEFKAARDALGMSVTDLAEWLGLDGEHGRTAIRQMESGKRDISGPIRRSMSLAKAAQAVLDHCAALDAEEADAIQRLADELDIVDAPNSEESQ